MTKIIDHLFIGGVLEARSFAGPFNKAFLCLVPEAREADGVPQIFDHADQNLVLFRGLKDEVNRAAEMRSALEECTEFIHAMRQQRRDVLVFCRWGQSRSATVVIAYLMMKLEYDLDTAFWHVRTSRNCIFPNIGFFAMLQTLDVELHGHLSMKETQHEYLAISAAGQTSPRMSASRTWKRVVRTVVSINAAGRRGSTENRTLSPASMSTVASSDPGVEVRDESNSEPPETLRAEPFSTQSPPRSAPLSGSCETPARSVFAASGKLCRAVWQKC
mmetsp:Transcript_50416/g.133978  ORF Transcript_50416/g.133978 Transcript_50416/m.133978 type:complete len:274 (-) Transcript_50416:87-908(-)